MKRPQNPEHGDTQARGPVRTCVGCRQRHEQGELLRVVAVPTEGGGWRLAVDWSGKAPGRGAYLAPEVSCVQKALRKGAITRALKCPGLEVPEAEALIGLMKEGLRQTFGQRLALARRAGVVDSGETRVSGCLKQDKGLLLVLASDMSASNQRKHGTNAARKGLPVVSPLTGDELGRRIGRPFAGMVLVHEQPFADDLERMARLLESLDPQE